MAGESIAVATHRPVDCGIHRLVAEDRCSGRCPTVAESECSRPRTSALPPPCLPEHVEGPVTAEALIRASDADRDRVAELLRDQLAQGRLNLDEFSERVGAVYAAITLGELERLVADLPVQLPERPADRDDALLPAAQGGQPDRLSVVVAGIPLTCLAVTAIFVALSSLPAMAIGVLAVLGLVVIGIGTVATWWHDPTRGSRSSATAAILPGSCCWPQPRQDGNRRSDGD